MATAILNQKSTGTQGVTMRTREMLESGQRVILRADYTTPYFRDFSIQNNRITFDRSFTSYYSQLLIDQVLPDKKTFCFQFKIQRCRNRGIFVGITNRKKHKNERNSHQFQDVFTFFGKKALVWPGRIEQTRGFGQDDTVTVKVDRINDTIEWYVNGYLHAHKSNAKIGRTQYQFVPFFQMIDEDDTIEWQGSWTQ